MTPHPAIFETLPNFFILGAAKSGTTTLAELLRRHPQVFLPFDKEPMFFSRDAFYTRGPDWYARTFFQGAAGFPARGEASPHYLHWSETAAPRLKGVYRDEPARFILIFREPAQRAYSWYWNMIKEGREDQPFEQALALEDQRLNDQVETLRAAGSMQYGYARGGCYAGLLEPFLARFPRENFLFLLQEDLREEAFESAWTRLLAFLNVDMSVPAIPEARNPAALPRSRRLQQVMTGSGRLKEWIKRILPQQARYRFKSAVLAANARVTQYPPMRPETERALRLRFQAENRRLEEIIGRDLSSWSAS